MSLRAGSSQLFAGSLVASAYQGLGIRGDQVPSTGTNGASPVYNDLSLPADAAKEYRWVITVPPAQGWLQTSEDLTFAFNAPPGIDDFTDAFTYELFQDGVSAGTATVTIVVGTGGADVTPPTLTGSINVTSLAPTSYTLNWPAGADNVGVTSYERSLDGGTSWADVGNVLTVNVTGRTPSTTDQVRVRAKDAAGNVSTPPLSAAVNLPAAPDTTPPTLTGSITIGTVTSSSIQMSWPAGADDVAVTGYDVSRDGGGSWTQLGNVLTHTFTGLSAATPYALRVRAKDAAGNASAPPLSATQNTAAAADTTPPALSGSITVTSLTSTAYTLTWPAGSDNVAVSSYERSLDGGGSWVDVGDVLTVNISGRTPGATDQVRVRAKDEAGNVSAALSTSVNLPAVTATIVTDPVKDYTGAVLANTSIDHVTFIRLSNGAAALTLSDQVTSGTGTLTLSSASLVAGVTYLVLLYSADDVQRGVKAYTAA